MARPRNNPKPKKTKSNRKKHKNEAAKKRMQKYRDNLKKDPKKLEEFRAKDRGRKRKSREVGPPKDLTERELRKKRRDRRDYMRRYRAKIKRENVLLQDNLPEKSK